MTDTKKPTPVETAAAPLGRPYAETHHRGCARMLYGCGLCC